ncbi:MAG: PIN domain-containing protein [Bacteroidaceae bacterium]|nr:PIN domain-containing protein [Bacteroidaceae bacterium]
MKNVFIDTNVFVDFIAHREEFYEPAALIISLASRKRINLLVSALSFATASYLLEHHYKMSSNEIIEDYQCFISLCNVTTVNQEIVKLSVNSNFLDFEDAMQHFSAVMDGADYIVTRNKPDFALSKIPVYEPQEFLQMLVQS